MTKQFSKTNLINFLATALLTGALTLGSINPASANGNNNTKPAISFTGVKDDLLTFNIKYNNPSGDYFILELVDDQERLLYTNKFNDAAFNKNIALKNMGEKTRINFIVKAGKNTANQKFDIEPKVKVVEELIVTQL